jgi:phenylacetate-CoA ligase
MSGWYEAAFRKVLFPAYESGLRRRQTLGWLRDYERDQWLPPEELAALQWRRLKRLLEHCEREVPYYQRCWRELGVTAADIRNLDDYAQLPLLTKADIRENSDALQASSWRGRLLFKNTGGSTGEPLRFGYTRESNDRRTAVMWRGYGWADSRMGRRTLFLWGGAVGDPTRAHQFKDRAYNALFARRVLNTFHMTEANLAEYADAIDRYRPQIIVAYVGPLVRLAQWLLATGRTIHKPQAIIGAAEALHEFQRAIIEQAFGAGVQYLRLPRIHAGCGRVRTAPRPARERRSPGGRTADRCRCRSGRAGRRCGDHRPVQLRHAAAALCQRRRGHRRDWCLRMRPRAAAAGKDRWAQARCHPHAGRPRAAG